MNHFHVRDDEHWCEEVPLRALAQECGTPLYVYSHATLERHFAAFDSAFDGVPHLTCYAVKANSNLAVLGLLAGWGAGMDVVSGGELFRALRAGADPKKIVYAGVGKTAREIAEALRAGILMFNLESTDELRQVDRVAGGLGLRAPVALRVNPAIDPLTTQVYRHGPQGEQVRRRGQPHPRPPMVVSQRLAQSVCVGGVVVHRHRRCVRSLRTAVAAVVIEDQGVLVR